MFIPQYLNLFGYSVASIFLILLLATFVTLFVYWNETRRDGFDEEHALDLFIFSLFTALIMSRFAFAVFEDLPFREILPHILRFWEYGFDPVGLVIGLFFPIVFFTRSWKWSIYRISDTLMISLAFGSVFLLAGLYGLYGDFKYLWVSLVYLVSSLFLLRIRLKVRSGLVFSLFMLLNAGVGIVLERTLLYLIFYAVLITISILNLYLREKRNPMTTNLSTDFLKKIKSLLTEKEKELQVEQNLIIDEDPYLEDGRDVDNSDTLDDAFEDTQKEISDHRKEGVTTMLQKVQKAIARINTGTYGVCSTCGKEISKERLKAFPEANLCKACATETPEA